MAASGLGLILGSLGAGWAAARWGTAVAYGGSIGVMSLMLGATAVVSTVWVAAIFVVAYGLGNGIAVVVNSLLVQRGIPDHLRGRAFTLAMSLTYSALFIGMLAGGFISDAYGARWAWGVASIIAGVAAVASYALARGIPRTRSTSRWSRSRSCRLRRPTPPSSARCTSNLRGRGAAAGVDARDPRRGRPRRRHACARARDHPRRELRPARVRASSATLYPETGRAYAIGVTGPPGVGKSTLIGALVRHVRAQEQTVGVISVDPSSPFTHGALLGDRIRLADHFLDPGVFIRSMGTRGHLGGLAESTLQAMLVLDAGGKDVIFLETVGAGQSEVEVIGVADTVAARADAGLGRLGAGAEGGDHGDPRRDRRQQVDHPAAKTMLNEVRSILALDHERAWKPPIVLTEAMRGENVDELWDEVERTARSSRSDGGSRSGGGGTSRARCSRSPRRGRRPTWSTPSRDDPELRRLLDEVQRRELDPLTAVREIMEKVFRVGDENGARHSLTSAPRASGFDGVARETPVYVSESFARMTGREVWLKAENLQRTGSFKIRGAVNRIASLSTEERAAGVVAVSAGNHAQAVAWAAREAGIDATIFMPQDAPVAKVEATQNYGAKIELGGEMFDDAQAHANAYAETSRRDVRPSLRGRARDRGSGDDRPRARRAAAGRRDPRRPDRRRWARLGHRDRREELKPELRIVGVQAAACAPFAGGVSHGFTIAEGIAVKNPGELTMSIVNDLSTTSSRSRTRRSARRSCSRSSAPSCSSRAPARRRSPLCSRSRRRQGAVGGAPSGGNIDPSLLISVIRHGLTLAGRYLVVRTRIPDRPGELIKLLSLSRKSG